MSLQICGYETWSGPLKLHGECFPSTSPSHSNLTVSCLSSTFKPSTYPPQIALSFLTPSYQFCLPLCTEKMEMIYLVDIEMNHPHLFQGKSHYPSCWESCQQVSSCSLLLQSPPHLSRARGYSLPEEAQRDVGGSSTKAPELFCGGVVKALSYMHCSLDFSSTESCFFPPFSIGVDP